MKILIDKLAIFLIIFLIIFSNCTKDDIVNIKREGMKSEEQSQASFYNQKIEDIPYNTFAMTISLKNLSYILSRAIKNYPELRIFIKEEALKKFDYDYDILFQNIKDEVIYNKRTIIDYLILSYMEIFKVRESEA